MLEYQTRGSIFTILSVIFRSLKNLINFININTSFNLKKKQKNTEPESFTILPFCLFATERDATLFGFYTHQGPQAHRSCLVWSQDRAWGHEAGPASPGARSTATAQLCSSTREAALTLPGRGLCLKQQHLSKQTLGFLSASLGCCHSTFECT